ncbi:hypothetical protein STAWA0001_0344 [Staphylococcus warneri L37603]|nr:hypothetical protein STAWA0001_0344 [Staphylococcus warneri L37603]
MAANIYVDPACGAGNFLNLAYAKLREIETDLLADQRRRTGSQDPVPRRELGPADPHRPVLRNRDQLVAGQDRRDRHVPRGPPGQPAAGRRARPGPGTPADQDHRHDLPTRRAHPRLVSGPPRPGRAHVRVRQPPVPR